MNHEHLDHPAHAAAPVAERGFFRRAALHRAAGAGAIVALEAAGLAGLGKPAAAQTATPAGAACAATPGPAGGVPPAGPNGPRCGAISLEDIYFSPNLITIPAGEPVAFALTNHGAAPHDFSVTAHKSPRVKDLGVSVDVAPGKTETVEVEAPAGTYYFFCDIPGHEQAGMFGYIRAEAGAQVETETATVTPPAGS
jgi:uncharacterized cupredoxin-like copper-binding protein